MSTRWPCTPGAARRLPADERRVWLLQPHPAGRVLGLGGVWAAIFFAIGLALVVRRLVGLAHAVVADGSLSRADLAIVLSAGALTVDLLSGWAIVRRLRAP